MHRILLFVLFIAFVSCNDTTSEHSFLADPPYGQLTDSIKQAPGNADLYYRRGSLLYSNSQPEAAAQDLRQAWQLEPREEYAMGLALVLRQKNADSAIAFLSEAVKRLPNSIPIQLALARGYQQKKQPDAALRICEAILARDPQNQQALLLQSELLKNDSNDAAALAKLEKAYAAAPADGEVVQNLAFAYAEAGNPKALALADTLIHADTRGRHAEPYYFKGVYYSNTNHPQEAIKAFDAAIQHDFHFLNAYINKGIVYYDQKKYALALKTFNLAATVFADEADPYYWLGKTQEAMGNKDEALLNYQRAYGLDKTNTEAKEAITRLSGH